jgi:hypothetical protein
MHLNTDLLMQHVPGWGLWFFGPHMGGFKFLLFLLVMFLVLSFLRGAGGNRGIGRHRGGHYRPDPPRYHSGHTYQGHGPFYSDVPRGEPSPGETGAHKPWAGRHAAPYGTSSQDPYAGYGTDGPPSAEGQATVRVDSLSSGEGQPTLRVTPPAATMRMESTETGGQSTTPLGGTRGQSSEKAATEPGVTGRTEDSDS